jgi:hypothetical protein
LKRRRKFARVSEEMKQWSTLLASELAAWPAVTSRRMFGMTVFYRRGSVFAALPLTRSFDTPRSIAFKLYKKTRQVSQLLMSDARIMRPESEDGKWISFEVNSEKDLSDAIKWFDHAYRASSQRAISK